MSYSRTAIGLAITSPTSAESGFYSMPKFVALQFRQCFLYVFVLLMFSHYLP